LSQLKIQCQFDEHGSPLIDGGISELLTPLLQRGQNRCRQFSGQVQKIALFPIIAAEPFINDEPYIRCPITRIIVRVIALSVSRVDFAFGSRTRLSRRRLANLNIVVRVNRMWKFRKV